MAKAKAAAIKRTARERRRWPKRADLVPWLQCYLDLCERYPQAEKAGVKACVPLKQLAECGHEKASLARLQRLLDRLPRSECEATGFLALTGAQICVDLPDCRRAEKYLQLAEARQSIAKPRVRTALQSNLRYLRAANALPDASLDANRENRFGQLNGTGSSSVADQFSVASLDALAKAGQFSGSPGLSSRRARRADAGNKCETSS